MSAVSALHVGLHAAWDAGGLDAIFRAYWAAGDTSEFAVLNDTEATPAQPFPYCVYSLAEPKTNIRMTGSGRNRARWESVEVPCEFVIYARSFQQHPAKSAKQIAAELADSVMAVFGGHATTEPAAITLSVGSVLLMTKDFDFGMREGSQEHSWKIKYRVILDVPVAA